MRCIGSTAFLVVLSGIALGCGNVVSDVSDARITAIDARLADASTVPDAGPSAFEIVSAPTNDVAVGYVDSSGANTAVLFDNHNRAAQCRSGHVPEVDQLAYSDCPTPDGLGVVTYEVQATTGKTDGAYRFDIKYLDENNAQQLYSLPIYLHRSLNTVALCNNDASWPNDAAFFAAAAAPIVLPATYTRPPSWFDGNRNGALPHTVPFADIDITAPTYQFGFTNVSGNRATGVRTRGGILSIASENSNGTIATTSYNAGADDSFDLQLLSLRHRFALNADHTLLLVHRRFESQNARRWFGEHYCAIHARWFYTGDASGSTSNCDALVLNAAGEGFCMVVGANGVPQQSIFSRLLITKLARATHASAPGLGLHVAPTERGALTDLSMWSRSYYDALDAEPDDDFVDMTNADHQGTPMPVTILRP